MGDLMSSPMGQTDSSAMGAMDAPQQTQSMGADMGGMGQQPQQWQGLMNNWQQQPMTGQQFSPWGQQGIMQGWQQYAQQMTAPWNQQGGIMDNWRRFREESPWTGKNSYAKRMSEDDEDKRDGW